MAVSGDFAKLRALRRSLQGMVTPGEGQHKAMAGAVIRAVKDAVKQQFREGIGPEGTSQVDRKSDGNPGLQSAKMARGMLDAKIDGDAVRFCSKNPKRWPDILEAHQEGHVFPARRQALERNAKGRLIRHSKFRAMAGGKIEVRSDDVTSYARQLKSGLLKEAASRQVARIGQRVLPQRRIHPDSTMPARWDDAIAASLAKRIERLFLKFG
jgi:hypothetical protein